ncbi:MAG: hypothetical protein ABSH38_05115 [Verrucomicrobiota bacterium]
MKSQAEQPQQDAAAGEASPPATARFGLTDRAAWCSLLDMSFQAATRCRFPSIA